jgi:RsiW-degrading membrane proteinase PrsW (M82 family)
VSFFAPVEIGTLQQGSEDRGKMRHAHKVAADPLDISYGELLPFLSWHDLRRRGFLGPGITTAVFGVAMFLVIGFNNGVTPFFYILTGFLGLASLYLIYLWCGKKMPFAYVLLLTFLIFVVNFFLLIPIVGYANDHLPFPIEPALTEEPWKALPVLLIWVVSRYLGPAKRRKYGVREPLDGILLAAASATAFAFIETMFQYMPQHGADVGPPRFLFNIYGHIAYSAVFGYYVGLAALHHHRPKRVVGALILGLFLAGTLHDLWDAPGLIPSMLSTNAQNFLKAHILDYAAAVSLWEIVMCIVALVILAAMILKGREVSPEHEFLWPFGSMPAYRAPLIEPLPETPPMPGDPWLAIGSRRVRLSLGAGLTGGDIPCLVAAAADGIVAQVMPHPSEPAMSVLRNLSRSTWEAVRVDGTVRDVAAAETIRLIPGTRIDFGTMAGAVLLTPHDPTADPAVAQPDADSMPGTEPSPNSV